MNKVFHLSSCDTCKKILNDTNAASVCTLQDIKVTNISAEELDDLAVKVGSYEALFSRRALKFRAMGLHEKTLSEADYRELMLQEYTFLKRPFIIIGDNVFIGNTAKVIEAAKKVMSYEL
ncbi:MAG: ArsC/Spx/MgsR family protein [Saprospiraceae bacterium]|nr:ArsC/Spx/MgsR family protein [Saprospiraceae bacterium]